MRSYYREKLALKTIAVLTVCALIAACGGAKTTSESSSSNIDGYGRSRKIEVSETGDSRVTTETIRTIEPKRPAQYSEEPGAEVTLDDRGIDNTAPSRTHLRAPGVAIDSDEATGEVHVNAPFVRINKDPHSGKVNVKVPFVNINAEASD
jgi:hypothetical protein